MAAVQQCTEEYEQQYKPDLEKRRQERDALERRRQEAELERLRADVMVSGGGGGSGGSGSGGGALPSAAAATAARPTGTRKPSKLQQLAEDAEDEALAGLD